MLIDANRSESITVTVIPTRGEYVNLNMWFTFGRTRSLLTIGIPYLLVLLYAFYLAPKLAQGRGLSPNTSLFTAVFASLVVAVCFPVGVYLGAVRRWNAASELREERQYTFTPEGIQVTGQTYAAFTLWSNIVRAGRLAGQVYLGTNQNQFHILPVATFGDRWDHFRALVTEQVKECRL